MVANDINALQQGLTNDYLAKAQMLDMSADFDSPYMASPMSLDNSIFENGLNYNNSYCSFNPYSSYSSYNTYGPTQKDLEYRNSHTQVEWERYQANQQEKLEDDNIERQVRREQKVASAKFRVESPDKNIASELGDLNKYVTDDEQYKVTDAYKQLEQQVKDKYKARGVIISDKDARSEIETQYYQQYNKNLLDDVEENGSGYFGQGFKEGLGCGLGYLLTENKNKTGKDNVNYITGHHRSTGDDAKMWTGRILAGAATGALALAAIPLLALGGAKGGVAYKNGIKALFSLLTKSKA